MLNPPGRIALVGDYDQGIVAHRAIDHCFELAGRTMSRAPRSEWLPTQAIVPGDQSVWNQFSGVWCVPGSPYQSTEGALWAIERARKSGTPFLGTCGGYQHALLEYARNVLRQAEADHQENTPGTSLPLLSRLSCSLIEMPQAVVITDVAFRPIYGADSGSELYHCSFGLNAAYEHLFRGSPLEFVARSPEGEPRAFKLRDHPFFVGTHFQPERSAFSGVLHPLVQAFFRAAGAEKL